MDLLNDKYVTEATPASRKVRIWKQYKQIAACFYLVLALGLYLFLPFDADLPDVSMYSGSEYYSVIQKLNEITYEKPVFKNNFSKIVTNITALFSLSKESDDYHPLNDEETYKETTDNQVAGVIEADLIKRSDKFIYYLNGSTLEVYSINGEQTEIVGKYFLSNKKYKFYNSYEFFLSDDCKTVTIFAKCSYDGGTDSIGVISLDVSDPTMIKEKKSFFITGSYITSRLTDGKLLLISRFNVRNHTNFSYEETFLPQFDDGSEMKSIPANDIISPDTLDMARYTVVSMFDEATLENKGCKALLSYSDTVYVSADGIYATRKYNEQEDKTNTVMTEVARLSYTGESLEYKGSVSLSGYVNNQYSLDEYENTLRIVTTTDKNGVTSASLYCVDLDSFKIVAEVEDFAPKGESVRSVRFDKKAAYVCTSENYTDPVFFFDMSDLSNITYTDTGTIDGFSTSLVNFGDGYLLGIGTSDWGHTLKIEIYKESENSVISVCKYEVENVSYSTNYKSYFIDREKRLIGLGFTAYDKSNPQRYVLLKFQNDSLQELVNTSLAGDNSKKRAVLIDNYFYMFGSYGFVVQEINQNIAK